MFFWILCWTKDGKYGLMGPYNSEYKARDIADKMDVSGYEIEKLPTMNKAKASSLVKAYMVQKHPEKFSRYTKRFSKVSKEKN